MSILRFPELSVDDETVDSVHGDMPVVVVEFDRAVIFSKPIPVRTGRAAEQSNDKVAPPRAAATSQELLRVLG